MPKTPLQRMANVFFTLGKEIRLDIIETLKGSEGFTPTALAAYMSLPLTTLATHLKKLTDSELIQKNRYGKFVIYSLNLNMLTELQSFFSELYREEKEKKEQEKE